MHTDCATRTPAPHVVEHEPNGPCWQRYVGQQGSAGHGVCEERHCWPAASHRVLGTGWPVRSSTQPQIVDKEPVCTPHVAVEHEPWFVQEQRYLGHSGWLHWRVAGAGHEPHMLSETWEVDAGHGGCADCTQMLWVTDTDCATPSSMQPVGQGWVVCWQL